MKRILLLFPLFFLCPVILHGAVYPLTFVDSTGQHITVSHQPKRIVSLVPSVTEILLQLGGSNIVVGSTYHTLFPADGNNRELVGGFFNPDMERVEALQPDIIFYAEIQRTAMSKFLGKVPSVCLSTKSIGESFKQIRLMGKLLEKEELAAAIVLEQTRQIDVIAKKISLVPSEKRKRVIRLMGSDPLMVPGDDSFQNEYIRKAGGIPPDFGRDGQIITLSKEDWQQFNPEIIYACGSAKKIPAIFQESGWKDVDAVKNNRFHFFPCALTCRASTHTGYFVSWLAASLYPEEFSDPSQQVLPEQIVSKKPLNLELDYVSSAELVESDIRDFRNKSVVLTFNKPMRVLSTLEGWRENIKMVGNHYWPPPTWGLGHSQKLKRTNEETMHVLGMESETASLLFTGANMDNLALSTKKYRQMEVTALVTAGVSGNALRMATDEGKYYELEGVENRNKPGTINIILLSNTRLTPRAMTRAMVSATEAKTAALQDLDVRSSYSPLVNGATGTGTDNILVVEGMGATVDASGGHTKMGELIARAVFEGVTEAVRKQNGFTSHRSVFQRIKERKISLKMFCRDVPDKRQIVAKLEKLLLDSRYSSFIESALVLSDAHLKGSIVNLAGIDAWCTIIAQEIAGKPVAIKVIDTKEIPLVLRKAMGALISGLQARTLTVKKMKVKVPENA